MANTIGLRVYRLDVVKRASRTQVPFTSPPLAQTPRAFAELFVDAHAAATKDDEIERTWFIEKLENGTNNIRGYIKYGTFGFESNFVDARTKKRNYRRKINDVEEIPLYFDFWFPAGQNYALLAFQSFQARSCIGLIISGMKEVFERSHREYIMRIIKLSPYSIDGLFANAPIKRIRFTAKNASGDGVDDYVGKNQVVDLEVTLTAKRKHNLGKFGSFINRIPENKTGVIEFNGDEYDSVAADVQFGGKLRRIGVFGSNRDAGVIDLTSSIEKGTDGHPTFESIKKETEHLLASFYTALRQKP